MPETRTCLSRRQCLSALAATATLVTSASAQQPAAANIRSITRFAVKPERAGDFRSLVKEINGVFAKAGHKTGTTWWLSESGRGELVVVAYHTTWAEMNEPPAAIREARADLAPLRARLGQCYDRMERIVDVILPEYSIRSSEGPARVSVLRLLIKPESVDPFLQLVKSDLFPAVRKSEISPYVLARTRLGGPNSEFRSSMGMKSWGDLDQPSPIINGMGGQANYDKFLAKIRPMLVEAEYNIYSHQAELAYRPSV